MIEYKPMTTAKEWQWMKSRTHLILCEDSQGIVAYDDGKIVAMCVGDSFGVDCCNLHMAIDNPMVIRRGFLTAIADHFFYTCKRQRFFGLVPDNNDKAIKLNKHIGFREVARVPDTIRAGVGYVIMRMDKAECRWLSRNTEHQEAA